MHSERIWRVPLDLEIPCLCRWVYIYISFSLTLSCEGEGFKENFKIVFQQDVESYDPILNPVLNRELRKTGGRILITLGDQEIDFFPKFNIFLSTRNPNVRFKEFTTWCFICKLNTSEFRIHTLKVHVISYYLG